MYLYQRRSQIKKELAKNKARQVNKRLCPKCGDALVFVESTGDRDTFICEACSDTISFGKTVDQIQAKTKNKKMNLITLRERSPKKDNKDSVAVDAIPEQETDLPVNDIRKSMADKSVISFDYYKVGAKQAVNRSVEPYKLTVNGSGELVLYGYDLEAGSIRLFKLGRMRRVASTEYTYKPRWDVIDKTRKIDE